MPMIPKPPIAAEVADVIGVWAEQVDNRSLLMDKFVLHKSWPSVYSDVSGTPIKMDDASRWSFIRMAQNGGDYLQREKDNLERTAKGHNARPENVERAKVKADLVAKLKSCACRKLPYDLVRQKLVQTKQFAEALSQRGAAVVYAELGSRLIINLSDSLIQNAGICLDRHTGLPYIPGSAVKGVTRHVALSRLRRGDLSLSDFKAIFGSSESDFKNTKKSIGELSDFADALTEAEMTQKGGVDFLAAYPVEKEPLIAVDISNVHRPVYYASGKVEDLAKEMPRPNTFPTVEQGARFAFFVVQNAIGVSPELFSRVREFLVEAITLCGIGGKTGAGYGWFKDVTSEVEAKVSAEAERAKEKRQKERAAAEEAERAAALRAEQARKAALSPCERVLEEWTKSKIKGIVNGRRMVHFDELEKDEKRGIVDALRTDGIGAEVWAFLKTEERNPKRKIKHAPAAVSAINRFVKAEKLEKMP